IPNIRQDRSNCVRSGSKNTGIGLSTKASAAGTPGNPESSSIPFQGFWQRPCPRAMPFGGGRSPLTANGRPRLVFFGDSPVLSSMLLVGRSSEDPPMDWTVLREELPVTRRWAFFDHAAVAPLTRRAQLALAEWAADMAENGDVHAARWTQRVEEVRRLAGQ